MKTEIISYECRSRRGRVVISFDSLQSAQQHRDSASERGVTLHIVRVIRIEEEIN